MTATVILLAFFAAPPVAEKKPAFFGVQIALDKDDIVVQAVFPDSPAEKAGLKSTDVLLQINGVKPIGLNATVQVIKSLQPNKKVQVLIRRDGKEVTLDVVPAPVGS